MAERAFQTQLIRFGAGGLNIRARVDVVPPNQLTRMTNAVRLRTGSITGRPGETALTTPVGGHTTIHSIGRLDDTLTASYTRIWGIDHDLYYGVSGVLTLAESGFSGDPLTMIAADPPIPGTPWMYIADSTKMRKIRADGLDLEIGLPPGVLVSTAVGSTPLILAVEPFTAVAGFTGYTDPFDPSAGIPTLSVVTDPLGAPTNALEITTDPGTDTAEYTNFVDKSIGPLDLSAYPGVTPPVPATDDDFMHLWLQPSADVTGVILYLTSGTFTPGNVPGTVIGTNDHAARAIITFSPAQVAIWNEFGTGALPLRRSDFNLSGMLPWVQPIDWTNVTGLSIRVMVGSAVPATLDFWDFTEVATRDASGGPVVVPYDYRITNYDPRTGVEGNPSAVQPESNFISDLGTYVLITPQAYGDAAVRQRAYRRGGTLPDNWYFVGENVSDGGPIYDSASDASIATSPTVEINHDQPVTSIATDGSTLLAAPIPIIFGPVQGLFFGLGDPHRPSTVYWTLPDQPDYWPATFTYPVCATAEPLQTGCIWGGEGYVASATRWFRLIPNLSDASNVTAQPSGATKGVVSRWAMVVGPKGVEYISDDGWYLHTGGPQENLSDAEMWPLFNGLPANEHLPIDFAHPEALRMGTVENDVWLVYQNTAGTRECLVRNTLTGEWRIVTFAKAPTVVVGESEHAAAPPKLLLIGGATTATAYTHTGTSDDGVAIAGHIRTAALDQGFPRQQKQYGDVAVKLEQHDATVSLTAFLDDESVILATLPVLADGVSMLDPFGTLPREGRNVSLDLSWSTALVPPVIDFAGPSYFIQPDQTVDRISDWDDGGSQAEKYTKGLILDCDTGGVPKTVVVEGTLYNSAVFTITTLTVTADGRRKLTFAWPPVVASFIRLRPEGTGDWTRWSAQYVFDELPLRFNRWTTEPLDHGIVGWKTVTEFPMLTVQSFDTITLTVVAFYDNGGSVSEVYTIPSTAGVKTALRLTLRAGKGVLYQYTFTSPLPFLVYREETALFVKALAGPIAVKHFVGNDALDLIRGSQSAEGTALAPGGGE